jgi:hypothetical protein
VPALLSTQARPISRPSSRAEVRMISHPHTTNTRFTPAI